jgi:transcription elongation regulator 1
VPLIEPCDWSEHTSPDGKKYYYNAKSGESVWEKPKELADFEARVKGVPPGPGPNPVPAVSAPAKLTEAATINIIASNGDTVAATEKVTEVSNTAAADVTKSPVATTTVAAAAVTATVATVMSAADKSKPVSSSPVSGTPWCVVWTGDNRVFFYNPTTKTSVWERPPELVGRSDVSEMMK